MINNYYIGNCKDIVSNVQGTIKEVKVKAGDVVSAGQAVIVVQQSGKVRLRGI